MKKGFFENLAFCGDFCQFRVKSKKASTFVLQCLFFLKISKAKSILKKPVT